MKYDRLVVFIRDDSAEIFGFRYGITLGIGTKKYMASTGDFVSRKSQTSSMILT
jgi:hypothetical protein